MKISDLKQPYRRMAEYYRIVERSELTGRIEIYIPDEFPEPDFNNWFWTEIKKGKHPPITEDIKEHFPADFDFSGEESSSNVHDDLIKAVYIPKEIKELSNIKQMNNAFFDKENQRKMEDEDLQKRIYTQLAKEGKFDELPATCEFSEAVELEVSNNKEFFELYKITGKYRESFISGPPIGQIYAYRNAQLPTQKIDFSQFTTDDVVEVETKNYGLFYGVFCVNEVDFIRITFGDKSDLTKQFYKDQIKSITKIK
jgi:hypothetical protein